MDEPKTRWNTCKRCKTVNPSETTVYCIDCGLLLARWLDGDTEADYVPRFDGAYYDDEYQEPETDQLSRLPSD